MGYLTSARELAPVLGVGKSKAAELAKEPWLAALRRKEGWDEEEVRRAIAEREKGEATAAPVELGDEDRTLVERLKASTDPVELARVSAQLAGRRLARQIEEGEKGGAAEGLKRSLEEWRRTEAAALELARERGELIELDEAKAAIGATVARSVAAFDRYEASLAAKVEEWLADPAFARVTMEDRARAVRAWARETTHAIRSMAADEIERLLVEHRSQGA